MPLLALLKHPLVGGEGDERLAWLDAVRALDLALRGPRPAAGLAGLDAHFGDACANGRRVRPRVEALDGLLARTDLACASLRRRLRERGASARRRRGVARAGRAHGGRTARRAARRRQRRQRLTVAADDAVPLLRQLLDARAVRPPYGGHPRIFIWGLLEARLQQADLMILGGLNEGVWPALPAPDPWLPPKVRADARDCRRSSLASGLPRTISRARSARREVLITRARRDAASPTVASRFCCGSRR